VSFNSKTAASSAAASNATSQQNQQTLLGTTSLDDYNIASLDPRYSDKEIKRVAVVFENQIADMFANSRFADVPALIDPIIQSFKGRWEPVQEHEDHVIRAFWDEREFFHYRRFHQKPVRWGLPSLSRLFYLMAAAESRLFQFSLAYTSLLNAWEYEPDHPGIWMAKGNLLNWENRFAEAFEAYQTGATIRSWAPPSVVANCLHGQGVALGALRRLAEAESAFAKALELDPAYEDARRDLERVRCDLKELRKREVVEPAPAYLM
jgi:tetratricopeptide (TPR) repeat protein